MSSSVRTPGAYFASAALHAVLIVLVVWFTWANNRPKEQPQIFELVAGEGDNFAAIEAPAIGEPDAPDASDAPDVPSVKVDIPPPPDPVIEPMIEPEPPEVSPVIAPPSPVQPPLVVPPVKPPPKTTPAAVKDPTPPTKKMTKAEFDRLNKTKKNTPSQKRATAPIVPKRIDTAGIAKGVTGGSTANKTAGAGGKALTRQDIELSEAYIALLRQRLMKAHEKPEGLSDLLEATVRFRLTSSGLVTNVVVISSSRNNEFDQSVLAAFRRISLPPPPANLKTSDYTITFKMREDS